MDQSYHSVNPQRFNFMFSYAKESVCNDLLNCSLSKIFPVIFAQLTKVLNSLLSNLHPPDIFKQHDLCRLFVARLR